MALATKDDVLERLEDTPTSQMVVMIEAYLEDASDEARYHGGQEWPDSTAPGPVKRMVATAVARFMNNPARLQSSRAGDETLMWLEGQVDWFTDREAERLARIGADGKLPSFGSIMLYAHSQRPAPKHPPYDALIYDGSKGFPFFTEWEVDGP